MHTVKLSQLKPGPNVRQSYDQGSIAEMADSIEAVGVLQNLLVRPAMRGGRGPPLQGASGSAQGGPYR